MTATGKGPGRPPGPTGEARELTKRQRWSAKEWQEVERQAEAEGVTPSELIRRATLYRCRTG